MPMLPRLPFSRLSLIASLLVLAACATPREACISEAQSQLRVLTKLAAETRGNIDRGFALRTETELRTIRDTCTGRNEDGTTFTFRCDRTESFDRRVPVAIDLNAEQEKLASLETRIASEQRRAQAAVQTCIAVHPE